MTVALALLIGACGGSGDEPGPPSRSTPAQGPTQGTAAPLQSQNLMQNPKVRVDLLALERVSDSAVVAKMRVVNQDTRDFAFKTALQEFSTDQRDLGTFDPNSVSAISLFDGVNSRRHFPLIGTDKRCLCTRYLGTPTVPAGQSLDLAAAFPAPPATVGRLGLLFPDAPPFLDVPVQNRPGDTLTLDKDHPAIDPAKTPTAPPRIAPVIATVENGAGAEDDDGTDLSVRISADVLFALNKADLTSRAQSILKEVAGKIDQSAGNTVRIDGHTDNSGNDAINNPLSERRAQNVEKELKGFVTRSGITYQSKGHGSSQPIASNNTAKGRQANRRVTVAFARPKRAATTASGTPASSGAPATVANIQAAGPPEYPGAWPRKTKVKIDGLRRAGDGYATLTWTVENDDPTVLRVDSLFSAVGEAYKGYSTSAVTMTAGNLRYRALRDDRGACLGPDFDVIGDPGIYEVGSGEKLTLTAMFKIPDDLTSVSVEIPGFEKANVTVG
jgi:outer membrane protein OmpA-like peptidoglycan-associated protein